MNDEDYFRKKTIKRFRTSSLSISSVYLEPDGFPLELNSPLRLQKRNRDYSSDGENEGCLKREDGYGDYQFLEFEGIGKS